MAGGWQEGGRERAAVELAVDRATRLVRVTKGMAAHMRLNPLFHAHITIIPADVQACNCKCRPANPQHNRVSSWGWQGVEACNF